ncbi:MAG: Subtilase family [Frankiaceae bacterium]|jgi:hypothetical protein|nr:Subtilase family [Frankiaceae bacterium]
MASTIARLAVLVAVLAAPAAAAPATAAPPRPSVIAVVGEPGGLNVLHTDFRTRDGRDAVLPAGVRAVRVALPRTGDFAARTATLAAGPLGHLKAGTLYYVAGTRLLVYAPRDPVGRSTTDIVTGDRLHATGVVDAAIGRRYGTAPDALAVFVAGGGAAPWEWVATQPWVDIATTSAYGTPQVAGSNGGTGGSVLCEGAAAVRRIVASGRLVFASSGNTTDQPEALVSPNGLPEVFQVGGVDAAGRSWRPGHTEESDPFYAGANVVRPYETGELFSFPAAAPDSFAGTVHFGGTSGATPRTAGWAALLVAAARAARGRFDGAEVAGLLRHAAVPAEAAGPGRYFVEGYGALNASAVARAAAVLHGRGTLPARPDEDAASAATRQARAALFNAVRCSA